MKTAISIFTLLLAVPAFSWGQADRTGQEEPVRKELLRSSPSDYPDYYTGKTSVDDGFGGTWNVIMDEGSVGNDKVDIMILRRPTSPPVTRKYFKSGHPIEGKRALPAELGVNLAFYGYIKELSDSACILSYELHEDPFTGEIKYVEFQFWSHHDANYLLRAVPPWNYTLYEEILKRTVKMFVYNRGYKPEDNPENLRNFMIVSFDDFAPGKDEPDFFQQEDEEDDFDYTTQPARFEYKFLKDY